MVGRPDFVLAAFGAAVLATAVAGNLAAATTGAVLRVDPQVLAVAKGEVFTLQVVQDSPVETSGAQASVDFDPGLLRIVSVDRGSGYATAPVFVPRDLQSTINAANTTGHLAQVAAAFTPPDFVPPGNASFLVVRFQAVGCGQTDVSLPTAGPFNAQLISGQPKGYGLEVPVTTAGAHVTTCVGADRVAGDVAHAGLVTLSGAFPVAPLAIAVAVVAGIVAVAGFALVRSRDRRQPHDEFID